VQPCPDRNSPREGGRADHGEQRDDDPEFAFHEALLLMKVTRCLL